MNAKINTICITNAFSIQMLSNVLEENPNATVQFTELWGVEISNVAAFSQEVDKCYQEISFFDHSGINAGIRLISAIGHEDTANVLGLPYNRMSISISKDEPIIVAQLQGGRLPEGATTLPEGFKFKFYLVEVL